MMMSMLEAGGIPLLVDHVRQADVDNPRGYCEFEPVKKTKQDASWVDSAHGMAVKMVYRLVYDLPEGHTYRVLFMRRRLSEVFASQEAMLKRTGGGGSMDEAKFVALFTPEIDRVTKWLDDQANFTVLDVNYNQLVEDPAPQVEQISRFLGDSVDVGKMCDAVDPSLHRQRR